jgi:probable phosphoglycerate mutase
MNTSKIKMLNHSIFLIRHGQTEWSLSGQHTSKTNLPLTSVGQNQARNLRSALDGKKFVAVLVSPLSRAQQTAELAGLGPQMEVCHDLSEFDYGDYEGLTSEEIRKREPGWSIWTHSCPNGETLSTVAGRCRRVITRLSELSAKDHSACDVALFAHGHVLRILAATWLDQPPDFGKNLMLDTATISALGYEHGTPTLKFWNYSPNS